jgi:hypothetical protein
VSFRELSGNAKAKILGILTGAVYLIIRGGIEFLK